MLSPKNKKEFASDTIIHAVTVSDFIENILVRKVSPFRVVPKYKILLSKLLVGLTSPLHFVLKADLLVENEMQGLYFVDVRLREVVSRLLDIGLIESWGELPNYPDAPPVIRYYVNMKIKGPVSGQYYFTEGYGVGEDKNQALLTALAEALERQSSFEWESQKLIKGSYSSLSEKSLAVFPQYFSNKQIAESDGDNIGVNDNDLVGWIHSKGLLDDKDYLVPAQMSYVLYGNEYPAEKIFMDSSTSGVAAGGSIEHATYRAICEAVERDALMGFWLNRLTPPRIDTSSIKVEPAQTIIKNLYRFGFEVEVLDITTDIGIPTYCAILIDPTNEVPVSMSAVTDLDSTQAIIKLMFELSKFAHYRKEEHKTMGHMTEDFDFTKVVTMEERRYVWSKSKMVKELDFFIKGEKQSFEPSLGEVGSNYADKLEITKKKISALKLSTYVAELTSAEARYFGLKVVRVIMPDLIPIHFSEKRKHLGLDRLYEFPVKLGYSSNQSKEADLNLIPHPFL